MLTLTDIVMVRASFARIASIRGAGADLFYDRLFAIAPSLRRLFPADLAQQKKKLMEMISTTIGGLNDFKKLAPAVKSLGARHAAYGVTAADYPSSARRCCGRSSKASPQNSSRKCVRPGSSCTT